MPLAKRTTWLVTAVVVLLVLEVAVVVIQPTPITTPVAQSPTTSLVIEQAVVNVPLAGPGADANSEFSGLAWYGDNLILLPQYPTRFGAGDGALFAIGKADILAFLDGTNKNPIQPRAIPFKASGLAQRVPGFEGYEAIGFVGDQIFLTVESKPGTMLGNLVKGKIAPDLSGIEIDVTTLLSIPPQADITNLSDETIVVTKDKILTMYEANGVNVNAKPIVHIFDFKPAALNTLPFPNIEYRITDATPTDNANRFWAINYFYPGDTKLKPIDDPLLARFGKGKTHTQYPQIERLVEFQYSDAGITLANTPPIQLLLPNTDARNWEGIARLDQRGFMIATDSFPQTILGFVPR